MTSGRTGIHAFVIGELAAGSVPNRVKLLSDLATYPRLNMASDEEVHYVLESRKLWGKGLGWIDLHLLAATRIAGWSLYTADGGMVKAARQMDVECL